MTAFLVDEDVAAAVAPILVSWGHDAVTVDDLRRKGSKDDAILWIADELQRILISHNLRDFVALHCAWHRWQVPERHAGILIPQQSVVWRPLDVAQNVSDFLALSLPVENELYMLRGDMLWQRFDTAAAIGDTSTLQIPVSYQVAAIDLLGRHILPRVTR